MEVISLKQLVELLRTDTRLSTALWFGISAEGMVPNWKSHHSCSRSCTGMIHIFFLYAVQNNFHEILFWFKSY